MQKNKTAFYAYASQPPEVTKLLARTIGHVNGMGGNFKIIDWRSIRVSGRIIINEICKNILNADLLICDITTHNHNVLFELGYAIAKRKPVRLTLNENIQNAVQRYEQLRSITTVGYIGYRSLHELSNKLLDELNSTETADIILKEYENSILNRPQHLSNSLFYMKSWIETKESISLQRALRRGQLTPIYDDPHEGPGQALSWYVENTFHAKAVLAHLSPNDNPKSNNDAMYSLAAGLAYGFGKPLLILAHAPHQAAIDYRDISFEHHDQSQCVSEFEKWAASLRSSGSERKSATEGLKSGTLDIRNVEIGQYVAENEERTLVDYFVQTDAYVDALESTDYLLFVGRKGTGKTANLIMLAKTIGDESRYARL